MPAPEARSAQPRPPSTGGRRWLLDPLKGLGAGLTGALMAFLGILLSILPLVLIIGAIGAVIYLIANG